MVRTIRCSFNDIKIFYSSTGDKVKPVVSLTYVQVFDHEWREIENVELIVPDGEGKYKPMTYPTFYQCQFIIMKSNNKVDSME